MKHFVCNIYIRLQQLDKRYMAYMSCLLKIKLSKKVYWTACAISSNNMNVHAILLFISNGTMCKF